MTTDQIAALLGAVAEGGVTVADALEKLKSLPFVDAGVGLTIDTHRALRLGMPEVVYAKNKTADQVLLALNVLVQSNGAALATMVSPDMARNLSSRFAGSSYDECSRLFRVGTMPLRETSWIAAVVCAGTSDLSVAEEAAQTLEFAGCTVRRVTDVGVAGLHRLLHKLDVLRDSRVIIAVAGMEGALPSVLAGLVAQPVIAVPTSVGYGANFQGLAALLSMLNSCSSGLGVVNIDNGFGAAMLAIRILQSGSRKTPN